MDMSSPEMERQIEEIVGQSVDKKIALYLAAEKEKAAKKENAPNK
jgi:hypothetical protein